MKRIALVIGFALAAGSLVAVPFAQQKGKPKFNTWHAYLGGSDSSQYSSLTQIDKSNVSQLQVAWTYPTGDMRTYRFNPVIVDGVMFVLALATAIMFGRIRAGAAWLLVPYLAWLAYAGFLTYRIAELNPGAETLVPSSSTTQII